MATFGVGQSLRQGQKARDKAGSDDHLSKILELNGKYRIFFKKFLIPDEDTGEPTQDADIRAAVVPGRVCDYEVVGTSFIPYTADMLEYDNETGSIRDLTNLEGWARISRVLFEASCIRAKKNAEAEAERTAAELQKPVDQLSLQKALEKIEMQYHGGEGPDGKQIMPTKSPAISGIKWKVSTRIAVVKMKADGSPDWKNAKYATYEVGKTKNDVLLGLLESREYCNLANDYLEVQYDYIGADKKAAGQSASFGGVTYDKLSLEVLYPEDWAKFGRKFIDGIITATDEESISTYLRARNRSLKNGGSVKGIIESYRKWLAQNQAVYGSIDFENEFTSRAAADFLENHLLDGLDSLKAKMEALAEENAKQRNKADEDDEAANVSETAEGGDVAESAPVSGDGQALSDIIAEQDKADQDALRAVAENVNMTDAQQTIRNIAQMGSNVEFDDSGDLGDL